MIYKQIGERMKEKREWGIICVTVSMVFIATIAWVITGIPFHHYGMIVAILLILSLIFFMAVDLGMKDDI